MFLYKLTNRTNGLSYIGATTRPRLNDRLGLHRHRAAKGDRTSLLHVAIAADGWESFDVVILAQPSTREELHAMERAAILAADTLTPNGYNMTAGGIGQWKRPMTTKAKAAISLANRNRHPWNFGRKTGPMSDEARLHMSLSRQGRKPWNKGIAVRPDTLEKINRLCGRPVAIAGIEYPTIAEAARKTGMTRMQVRYYLRKGH